MSMPDASYEVEEVVWEGAYNAYEGKALLATTKKAPTLRDGEGVGLQSEAEKA